MKNKKSLLGLGLLALVLVLGVGYAVVNTITLTFNGSASVADAELKVAITNVTSSKETDVTKSFTANTGTFGVTNMTLNEEVTFTFTVTNNETDVTAKLTEKTAVTGNTDYFEASYVINDGDRIAPKGTATVVVTVKMKKTPVAADDGSAEFEFVLDAAAVQ